MIGFRKRLTNTPPPIHPLPPARDRSVSPLGAIADGVFLRSSVEKEKGSETKLALEPMSVSNPRKRFRKHSLYSVPGGAEGDDDTPSASTNVSRRSSHARLDLNGKKGPQKGTVEYVAPLLERRDEVERRPGEWGQTFKEKCVRVGEGCIIGLHVLPSLLRNKGALLPTISLHPFNPLSHCTPSPHSLSPPPHPRPPSLPHPTPPHPTPPTHLSPSHPLPPGAPEWKDEISNGAPSVGCVSGITAVVSSSTVQGNHEQCKNNKCPFIVQLLGHISANIPSHTFSHAVVSSSTVQGNY